MGIRSGFSGTIAWAGKAIVVAIGLAKFCSLWLLRAITSFLSSIWHGSVRWGWFAVLLLGALGMTSSGEFGGALVVAILSLFSLGSKYWHWAKEKGGARARTNIVVFPLVICGFVFAYFIDNDMRGSAPWSHVPSAWNSMLIATTVSLKTLDIGAPKPPGIPSETASHLAPKNHRLSRPVRSLAILNILASRAIEVGGKSSITVTVRNNTNTALRARTWAASQNMPYSSDREKNLQIQEDFWAMALTFKKTNNAAIQELPVADQGISMSVESGAVNAADLANLNSHFTVPYMAILIKDLNNKTVLELCGFIQVNGVFGYCRLHNGP